MKTKYIAGASIGLLVLASHAAVDVVGIEKYTYDAAGNMVKKQIDNEVTRFGYEGNKLRVNNRGITYWHDDAGRLVRESSPGKKIRNLSYQYGDKVTQIVKDGCKTEVFYNAEGQIVGTASNGSSNTLAWDDLGLVMKGDEIFVIEEHPAGGVSVIAHGKPAVSDYLGSTFSVGETVFESTAFGEGLEDGLFTGKPFLEELDGFVFKFRYYLTEQSRWATADPSGFPDGANSYIYAMNSPTKYYDKLGLSGGHALEQTDNVNIDCWTDGTATVGVTSVLKSTFSSSPAVHRTFVYAYGGATGSSPSSNLSVNKPFEASAISSCSGHGLGFQNKYYKNGRVEGYVQVSYNGSQFGADGTAGLANTGIVHAEP